MAARHLADDVEASATRFPDRLAVVDATGKGLTYAKLNQQADAMASFLAEQGVGRGDRVGVVLPKGLPAVVACLGALKAGAAYVPVDWTAPTERAQRILSDCGVRAVVVDSRCLGVIPTDIDDASIATIVVGETAHRPDSSSFDAVISQRSVPVSLPRHSEDLAYILYTSGSTGMPKGVMLTHENATSFVDWCSSVFTPTEQDRFSSHAPLHFDLSILDVYVALKHGATVYLIPDDLGKNPKELAKFITANALTIWYSTPSTLTLLLQFGQLQLHDASSLRLVLFAGEVFPVKHLRALKKIWTHPTFFNLYGPTETNVCTFARIPASVPEDRDTPYPIGPACAHCESLVLDGDLNQVSAGHEGLLYIHGPSVFGGYWNRPVENAKAFVERGGKRWYNTGDLVRWVEGEGFIYAGRNDRMVKRRGYRIELGEIERALYLHPRTREAAVISVPDAEAGVQIVAFMACQGTDPSIVEMKTFCGTKVPAYMNPDRFVFREGLPKTSTDKIDYQALKGQLLSAGVR